jgi:hypothetical protein
VTLSQLNVYRHDRDHRALITLAPRVRAAVEQCLRDSIIVIDVDLTTVDSCDDSGLQVFLDVSRHAAETHVVRRVPSRNAPMRRSDDAAGSAVRRLAGYCGYSRVFGSGPVRRLWCVWTGACSDWRKCNWRKGGPRVGRVAVPESGGLTWCCLVVGGGNG